MVQPRAISSVGAFALVAGSMLGIGIFISPSMVAAAFHDPWWIVGAWILGGVVALAGAVSYAELGALMPESGGDYVYIREAMGPSAAFTANWVLSVAVFGGSIAAVAAAIGEYQLPTIFGVPAGTPLFETLGFHSPAWLSWLTYNKAFALLLVVALSLLNHLSVRWATRLQVLASLGPIVILVAVGAFALVALSQDTETVSALHRLTPDSGVGGADMLSAWLAIYFAYSGWNAASYVSGELQSPAKALKWGLIGGTIAITLLYAWLNYLFVDSLGVAELARSNEVGTVLAVKWFGEAGRWCFTVVLVLLFVGSINASVLSGARLTRAGSLDGVFWRGAAKLDPKRQTPARAIWLQCLWACGLVVTEQCHAIFELASAAMVLTGSLAVASLLILRRSRPDAHRPYRAWGYPWLPLLYLVSSVVVLVATVYRALAHSMGSPLPALGLALALLAWLLHYANRHYRRPSVAP